ncbi:hypothetical protein SRABI128_06412 [Microbacterium sp. Bi128]|nr:hypothetical protein SRABI128_06412 [Microbacterium sp. Bi128]
MPMTMLPAASSEVRDPADPPLVYSGGFRKPWSREMELSVPSALVREIVSVSIEWPKR